MPPKQQRVPIKRPQIKKQAKQVNQNLNQQDTESYGYESEYQHEREKERPQQTDKELNQDMLSKMLIPNNPQAPKNITQYDYLQRKVTTKHYDCIKLMNWIDGEIIHKDSNEAKIQEELQEKKQALIKEAQRNQELEDPGAYKYLEAIKQTMRNKFNYNAGKPRLKEEQLEKEEFQLNLHQVILQKVKLLNGKSLMPTSRIRLRKKIQKIKDYKSDNTVYKPSFKRC
ncbi:unnamed protein product [Paramecium primaurelia]|uniref:Uncharacterized protein n=1 Tax=Paramecium primaurelia TaxID=5886 RepID=A0A8S1N301_PARPR|nr:unnamed protein product [Paramecium primaurelia]